MLKEAVFLLLPLGFSSAEPLLIEDFNASGEMVGSSPRKGSGTWTEKRKYPNGGTLSKMLGLVRMDTDSIGDVEIAFEPMSNAILHAGFSILLDKAPTKPWMLPISFMGNNESGGDAVGRMFISVGGTPATFRVGVSNGADQVDWATEELPVGEKIRLILRAGESEEADFTQLLIQRGEDVEVIASTVREEFTPYLSGVALNLTNSDGVLFLDSLYVAESLSEAMNFADQPWLEVKGRSKRTTPRRRVQLRGSAWDSRDLARVKFRKGASGKLRTAKGTDQWNATVRLREGKNVIRVRGVSISGRKSKWERIVVRAVPSKL